MTYITKSIEFSAAHYYYVKSWTEQQNKDKFSICCGKTSHGHNYILHVTLKGFSEPDTGMIINLIDLKQILKDTIIAELDHKNLNKDVSYFQNIQPTTENLCKVCWQLLEKRLKDRLACVLIFEDEDLYSFYKGEPDMFYITRVYKFSASHRLHNDNLSEEENLKIFGKCNNYNAHGHNFKLEVSLKGQPDQFTGMVYDVLEMDNIINEAIISKFDHQYLNDIDDLKGMITTGENLTGFIWQRLDGKFKPANLYRVKLYETERNYFEYYGGW